MLHGQSRVPEYFELFLKLLRSTLLRMHVSHDATFEPQTQNDDDEALFSTGAVRGRATCTGRHYTEQSGRCLPDHCRD